MERENTIQARSSGVGKKRERERDKDKKKKKSDRAKTFANT